MRLSVKENTAINFCNYLLVSLASLFLFSSYSILATTPKPSYEEYLKGQLYTLTPENSMFPSATRNEGHTYQGKQYPAQDHYNDRTTLVFVPASVNLAEEFDVIVYFHGWYNNARNSLTTFKLGEQLIGSERNAILIIPQGPKNAPDSSGGRMEDAGHFRRFLTEVLSELGVTDKHPTANRNIILAGHSGAYRAMAFILMHGGITSSITEVYILDGLYSQIEKFSYWMEHSNGRLINIYTPDGGTRRESEELIEAMDVWRFPYVHIQGDVFEDQQLKEARIVFIASELGHNDVISKQNQLQRFLRTGATNHKD